MALYLVTGTAGFIGAALAAALLREGHDVVGADNLSTGFRENVPAGTRFFYGDCGAPDLYDGILPALPYDAVFHIAGQSSGEISFDDPVYDLQANAVSTLRLLRFALNNGCTRFIYAGSMSVYGVQPDAPVREDAPCRPQSFYGVSKLASERYLQLHEQFGVRFTSLRLFNVYGPGQNMTNMRQGMVSIFMSMMLESGHIHVKGRPDRYRDFVYIDDVVRAFTACLARRESEGRIMNIGGSGRLTVGALADKLTALSPTPVSVEYAGGTPGDLHGIYADISLARECLGYTPQVSPDEGLARMYAALTARSPA
ncbi:MAG: NAD-dependent epimerase/dehydratase family protein [Desulfovibrio sp.]|jgi:UDP-glucose 4-epimerase|nr:NAD-dependent epimerase/dehydratase family protein [Desulfovibrio sp.]